MRITVLLINHRGYFSATFHVLVCPFLFFGGVLCFLFPSLFTTHSSCVTFPRNLCFYSVLFQHKVVNCSYSVKLDVGVFNILKNACQSKQGGSSRSSLLQHFMCVNDKGRNLMCAHTTVYVGKVVIRYLMNISLFRLTRSLIKI